MTQANDYRYSFQKTHLSEKQTPKFASIELNPQTLDRKKQQSIKQMQSNLKKQIPTNTKQSYRKYKSVKEKSSNYACAQFLKKLQSSEKIRSNLKVFESSKSNNNKKIIQKSDSKESIVKSRKKIQKIISERSALSHIFGKATQSETKRNTNVKQIFFEKWELQSQVLKVASQNSIKEFKTIGVKQPKFNNNLKGHNFSQFYEQELLPTTLLNHQKTKSKVEIINPSHLPSIAQIGQKCSKNKSPTNLNKNFSKHFLAKNTLNAVKNRIKKQITVKNEEKYQLSNNKIHQIFDRINAFQLKQQLSLNSINDLELE